MSDNVLFVNACVNTEISRTYRLSKALLDELGGDVSEVRLENLDLRPFDSELLGRRAALAAENKFDECIFDLSRQFAEADIIVLASPYWGCTFNSLMKLYLEYADVVKIIYRYDSTGRVVGLCKAKSLYYVTTRGGYVDDAEDYGYLTVKKISEECGIRNCACVSASGLDIIGNDVNVILAESIRRMKDTVKKI